MEAVDNKEYQQRPLRLKVKYLEDRLDISRSDLKSLIKHSNQFIREIEIIDLARPLKKPRRVVQVFGDLRLFQDRLFHRVLAPQLKISPFSHGSVSGRDIRSNTLPHIHSAFGYSTDICNFFPSISSHRIYRLFSSDLGCEPDAARICTRLTTHDYHLALGMVTSPILANAVLARLDKRIAAVSSNVGLIYTRFVDDITLTGNFRLGANTGIVRAINSIASEHGFKLAKDQFGRLQDNFSITKLTVRNGKIDVNQAYLAGLLTHIDDSCLIAKGNHVDRPYLTESQLFGKIRFACWINPSRRAELMSRFRKIDWRAVEHHALAFGLIRMPRKIARPVR